MKIRQLLLIIFLFLGTVILHGSLVQAQTRRIELQWDANSESDVYLYRIFRGQDQNHLRQVDSVYHPTTTVSDYPLQRGVQYYYGVKAVDFSLNASPMSDLLSVAIPKIENLPSELILPADTTLVLNLDDYVVDPDNTDNQLQWTISGFSRVTVEFSRSEHTLTIITPADWSGSERGTFKVEDPDHLFDQTTMTIKAKYADQPPIFTTIPELSTPEDTPIQINLAHYVQDADSPVDSLKFSVDAVAHLQLALHDSLLKVIPDKDWNGKARIEVHAQDESGLTDSTTITLIVQAVDDAPVLAKLPNIRMPQDTTVSLDLNAYVWDVDNDKADLSWHFENYPHVTLSFNAQNGQLRISSPSQWSGFEYIRVSVEDPDGKMASDTLVVYVEKISYAPLLSAIPEIVFNEDQADKINLNDYVSDKDTPLANLYWEVRGNRHIHYQIDYVRKTVTLTADSNWFGNETFWLKVVDPDQHADSARVTVRVLPVNDPPQFKNFPAIDLSRINPRTVIYRNYVWDVDDTRDNLYLRVLYSGSVQITVRSDSVSFQVADDWYGTQTIRLSVQDAAGAADTTNVIVYRQNLQTAPRIVDLDSLHLEEDQTRSISLASHVQDPDNASGEITWNVQAPSYLGARLDGSGQQLRIQPAANWNGEDFVVLKATDPQGHFDYDTLQVVVLPVNDPPNIEAIPDIIMLAGTYFTLDLKNYLSDPDGYDDLQKVELLNNPQSFIGYYVNGFQATFFAPQGFHGQETFMLRVTDKAGAQAVAIFLLRVRSGSIAAGVDVHPFGSGTVIHVNWNSGLPTRDHLEYSLDYSFNQSTPTEAEFTTTHHVVLENLKPDKTYHFRVVSLNEQGLVIVNPDSVFKTGKAVKGVNVFPIPFKVNDASSGDGIYFTNLGSKAHLSIYNLLGDLVWQKDIRGPVFKWDVKNGNGHQVHSGLYLYRLKTDGKTYHGKLIIIR